MKSRAVCAAVGWLLGGAVLSAAAGVPEIVEEVNPDHYALEHSNLYVTAGMCRGFTPTSPMRYPGYQHDLARDYIHGFFSSLGLITELHPFWFNYGGSYIYTNCHNVIGAKLGTDTNAGYYIVGGHYDSVDLNIWQYCICPGADDNASGTAATLEAARVLSRHSFRATLIFIAFDAEEEGLKGSYAYVDAKTTTTPNSDNHRLSGIYRGNIKGMISADMIAFNNPARRDWAQFYGGYSTMSATKSNLAAALTQYAGLTWQDSGAIAASDHWPFYNPGGVDAVILIDDHGASPYYHSTNDVLGQTYGGTNYIDYLYATKMTRAIVGYLAEQAGLVPTVTLSVPDPEALEVNSNAAAFVVSRSDVFTNEVNVYYTVTGTATPGADYLALSGSVVISNGWTNAVIPVVPVMDDESEGQETVIITLVPHAAYGLGTATQGVATISDVKGTVILWR